MSGFGDLKHAKRDILPITDIRTRFQAKIGRDRLPNPITPSDIQPGEFCLKFANIARAQYHIRGISALIGYGERTINDIAFIKRKAADGSGQPVVLIYIMYFLFESI